MSEDILRRRGQVLRCDPATGKPVSWLPPERNAPNAHAALSGCVDCLQHAVDETRAAGLHSLATELDAHRDAVAGIALRLWGERGQR